MVDDGVSAGGGVGGKVEESGTGLKEGSEGESLAAYHSELVASCWGLKQSLQGTKLRLTSQRKQSQQQANITESHLQSANNNTNQPHCNLAKAVDLCQYSIC